MFPRFLLNPLAVFQFLVVNAILKNRTIDDTYGDSATGAKPTFRPADFWDGPSCPASKCYIRPPAGQAHENTYSAATYLAGQGARTAEFSFRGTDIYVFFILANNVPNAGTQTLCKFFLNGQLSYEYTHLPSSSPEYEYNRLVYSQHNLQNADHTLLISADGYDQLSFINFDYAIYTYEDDTAPPQPPPPAQTLSRPTSNPTDGPTFSSSTQSAPHTVITTISGSVVTQTTTPRLQDQSTRSLLGSASNSVSSDAQALPSGGTVNNSQTDASHKTPTGAIVGGTVGAVVIVLASIFLFIWCYRRSRKASTPSTAISPQRQPALVVPFTSLAPNVHSSETREVANRMLPNISSKRKCMQQAGHSTPYPTVNVPRQSSAQIHLVQNPSEAGSTVTRSTTSSSSHKTRRSSSHSISRHEDSRVSLLVQENQMMRVQIEQLQLQFGSGGGKRLPSDPPPGYFGASTP